MVDYLYSWLPLVRDVVPPFCAELVLRDGTRYFLHSVPTIDEETKSLVVRIWDLRAFSDKDISDLKATLNKVRNREDLHQEQNIHPKLDWANMRIHLSEIAYCVEWHDRLWPEDARPQIGFVHEPA